MKTLLILRHAKSSWKQPGLADHDRPLNGRGKRDAPRMGRLLLEEGLVPDLILSSSAARALATAEAVADESGAEAPDVWRSLYHAEPEAYLSLLRELGAEAETVMVVGHNPGMEELVYALTDRSERMPTAALAQVQLPIEDWSMISGRTEGRLQALWRPRELPRY